MNKKNTKKGSASKKLLPAIAMLTTSAVMLTTATYAWFTMSKEVSVEGIQLTATSPELIEVSFGKVTGTGAAAELTAPTNDDGDLSLWVHNAATGSVYTGFGKLSPASSTTGVNLFYASKAADKGKNVASDNEFIAVTVSSDEAVKKLKDGGATTETHADLTAQDAGGYYVDIPVWFRTTKQTDVSLGVKAAITGIDTTNDTALYKSTRVSILAAATDNDGTNTVSDTPASAGVIKLDDATYYTSSTNSLKGTSGLGAVNAAGSASSSSYADADIVNQYVSETSKGEQVAVVPASEAGNAYSAPKKYIIRIWLEGEDTECWDYNASQSFAVGLEFHDITA